MIRRPVTHVHIAVAVATFLFMALGTPPTFAAEPEPSHPNTPVRWQRLMYIGFKLWTAAYVLRPLACLMV